MPPLLSLTIPIYILYTTIQIYNLYYNFARSTPRINSTRHFVLPGKLTVFPILPPRENICFPDSFLVQVLENASHFHRSPKTTLSGIFNWTTYRILRSFLARRSFSGGGREVEVNDACRALISFSAPVGTSFYLQNTQKFHLL